MRPSVNGDGVGRRWGVGVAAITTLIGAMAFGLVASGYAERGARDTARRAAQTSKGAAKQVQGIGAAALEAARSSATSLQGQATQADRPSAADCVTVQQEPMGAGWCKPSELAERARQDANDASEGVSSALQEHAQKFPNGVGIACEGDGPSGTMPQGHATPPSVEDDGSAVNVSVTRPSVTSPTFDRGDLHCDPQTT